MKPLLKETAILPPNLRFIVVDNISHHLRYQICQYNDIKNNVRILNEFFEEFLMPLLLFCKRNTIVLLLIHELTYVPSLSQTKPFFYILYDRLETIDIVLNKALLDNKRRIEVLFNGGKWEVIYTIKSNGLAFY